MDKISTWVWVTISHAFYGLEWVSGCNMCVGVCMFVRGLVYACAHVRRQLCARRGRRSYQHWCLRQWWGQHPWGHLNDERERSAKGRKPLEDRHPHSVHSASCLLPCWPFRSKLNLIPITVCMCVCAYKCVFHYHMCTDTKSNTASLSNRNSLSNWTLRMDTCSCHPRKMTHYYF